MAVNAKERPKELGIILPQVSRLSGPYIPAAAPGYPPSTAGQAPRVNSIVKHKGKMGEDSTLEDAHAGARICAVNCLAATEQAVGSLDHATRILKVNGYVGAVSGFTQNPKVLDGAPNLLLEMFGNAGQHVRSAIGVQALPDNAVVGVEMVVLLKGLCEYPAV